MPTLEDTPAAVDLFAGPGGWDLGLARLTDRPAIGIEWDAAACRTATDAGLHRIRADVAHYPPEPFAHIPGLIGSPPCPSFSQSGNRGGRHIIALLAAALADLLHGHDARQQTYTASIPPIRAALETENARRKPEKRRTAEQLDAEARRQAGMSVLVLEPARWIHATRPRWVALEQVPAVLPIWQALARLLADLGYSTWAGTLNSADYGVPQTRQRSFLLASLDRTVHPPEPTHAENPAVDLFGTTLEPWMSMADALGWEPGEPMPTVMTGANSMVTSRTGSKAGEGGVEPYERPIDRPANADRWMVKPAIVELRRGGDRIHEGFTVSAPASTVTTRAGRWQIRTAAKTRPGDGVYQERSLDDPAPTVQTTADRWQIRTAAKTRPGDGTLPRPLDQPAPTLAFGHAAASWVFERPATTVAGDPRIQPPGHKMNSAVPPGRYATRAGVDAIRLEPWQAAVLQDFPADYPWHGTLTKRFEQIGNAVPPGLAAAALSAVIPLDQQGTRP